MSVRLCLQVSDFFCAWTWSCVFAVVSSVLCVYVCVSLCVCVYVCVFLSYHHTHVCYCKPAWTCLSWKIQYSNSLTYRHILNSFQSLLVELAAKSVIDLTHNRAVVLSKKKYVLAFTLPHAYLIILLVVRPYRKWSVEGAKILKRA